MKNIWKAGLVSIIFFILILFFQNRSTEEFHVENYNRSITTQSLPELPEKEEENEAEFENPIKRLQYEYEMLANPETGRIPNGIREKELNFAKSQRDISVLNIATRARGTSQTEATAFVSRGPYNIGGRTRALGIDITNEDVILAGGVSGGVWRSADAGQTWSRTSTVMQLPAVSALVQDQRTGNTDTWFYSAGEFFGNSASVTGAFYLGDGIFKSTDGGLSWTVIPSTTQNDNTNLGDFGLIGEIVIDNSNTVEREMYAARLGDIVRTTDDFNTFSIVLGANNTGYSYTDLAISSKGVLIGTVANNVNNGPNAQEGIYKSTDGLTWININPPIGLPSSYERIEIAFDPQNEDVFYAVGSKFLLKHNLKTGEWINLTGNLGVSSDSGQGHNAQEGYNLIMKVHPADSNTVFVGGTNLLRSSSAFNLGSDRVNIGGYREDNNPNSFPKYANHHPDLHALVFYPSDPNKMLSGSDGGVHLTLDNKAKGTSSPVAWQSLNNGYLTTQIYSIDYYRFDRGDELLIAGMQDNGTWGSNKNTSNEPWVELFGGDGSFSAITYNSLYVSAQEGQLRRFELNSENNTFEYKGDISPSSNEDDFLFINPFIYDPVNQDRLYVGAKGKVFYTNDIRVNPTNGAWLEISLGTARKNDFVSALAASIEPEGVLYLGTRNGKVFKVADINSELSAVEITGSNMPNGTITSITVDPANANRLFATFGNYGVISVWMSENSGQTWSSIAGNLEENANGSGSGPSLRYIEMLPNGTTPIYFVGTSLGLYKTTALNGDNTVWTQEATNTIGNSIVSMIKMRPVEGQVVVATHGNGVFQASYDVAFTPNINYSINYTAQEATLRGPVSYTAGQGFSYQWIKDGQDIAGATSAEYQATESGVYTLRVTDELGPVAVSNAINLSFDKTAPIVNSIVRLNPTQEQVETSEVVFQITFDEAVQGIATTSFELGGEVSGTIASVNSVSTMVFNVLVNSITGTGLLDLNIKFESGITDLFQNAFGGSILSEETYSIVDLTKPRASISRSIPTSEATNRTEVVFAVDFNEPVKNVGVEDFELSSASISATVDRVTANSATSYLVFVNGYSSDGLLNLDLKASTDIQDESGNAFDPNIISEESFTIDAALAPTATIKRNAPTVELINRPDVIFEVQFSEAVSNVDISDFELSANSIQATIAEITADSPSKYFIKVNGFSTEGLIDLDFTANTGIENEATNIFTGGITEEETYTLDFSAGPSVSITRKSPLTEKTNLTELTFEITFSEGVTNVDLSDFELAPGSVNAVILGVFSSSANTVYLVQVDQIESDGLVDLNIIATHDIENADGNRFNGNYSLDETYTIENIITSIDDPLMSDLMVTVEENPSSGVFNVRLSASIPLGFTYTITDSQGAAVFTAKASSYLIDDVITVDLSTVSNGVYILRMETQYGFIRTKLLKQ
ncbi:T9SS type A sorting domain-containing protein [Roseivirga echinicomitans]